MEPIEEGFVLNGTLIKEKYNEMRREIESLVEEIGVVPYILSYDGVDVRDVSRCKITESALESLIFLMNPFLDITSMDYLMDFTSLFEIDKNRFEGDEDDDSVDGQIILIKERFFRRLEKFKLRLLMTREDFENATVLTFRIPFESLASLTVQSYLSYFETVKLMMLRIRKGELLKSLETLLKTEIGLPSNLRKSLISDLMAKWVDDFALTVGISSSVIDAESGYYRAASHVGHMSLDLFETLLTHRRSFTIGKRLSDGQVFDEVIFPFYQEALSIVDDIYWNKTGHVDYAGRISSAIGNFLDFMDFRKFAAVDPLDSEIDQIRMYQNLANMMDKVSDEFESQVLDLISESMENHSREGKQIPDFKIVRLESVPFMRDFLFNYIAEVRQMTRGMRISTEDITCMSPIFMRDWAGQAVERIIFSRLKSIIKVGENLFEYDILVDQDHEEYRGNMVTWTATDIKALISHVISSTSTSTSTSSASTASIADNIKAGYFEESYGQNYQSKPWSPQLIVDLTEIRETQINAQVKKNIARLVTKIKIEDLDFWDYSKGVCVRCLHSVHFGDSHERKGFGGGGKQQSNGRKKKSHRSSVVSPKQKKLGTLVNPKVSLPMKP